MREIYVLLVVTGPGARQFWFGANPALLNERIREQWRWGRAAVEAGRYVFGAGLKPAAVERSSAGVPAFALGEKAAGAELLSLRSTDRLVACDHCQEVEVRAAGRAGAAPAGCAWCESPRRALAPRRL